MSPSARQQAKLTCGTVRIGTKGICTTVVRYWSKATKRSSDRPIGDTKLLPNHGVLGELFYFNLFLMSDHILNTPNAPDPVGPYNQAKWAGNTLFVSGQIAIDPATGTLVTGTIEEETDRVLKNIKAILDAAGLGFADVVKCSVFVADIQQYDRINAVYAQYFDKPSAPARELVEVRALPKNVNVEISVIAQKQNG